MTAPLRRRAATAARTVHQADALEWLAQHRPLVGASVVTSLPDTSELPELSLDDWQAWFVQAAALTMSSVPDEAASPSSSRATSATAASGSTRPA